MNGVVTILFTDLVGSTELLGKLGEERADELRRSHFAMMRAALAAHGGDEVKNIGDSIMAAFTSPARAVACAIEMQQRVDAHARAGGPRVAIRVGVNAGEATEEDGDYFGTPVVIAKRLCDAAQGGQILISDVVRALVGSRGGFVFKELGALPLKGIEDPVPACEIGWEPLDEGVPLPATIAADRTVVIGREPERAALRDAFARSRDGRQSLVLIAGEPGIGKTSLAFDLARDAHAAGAMVLYGRCEEEVAIPFQPFAEALGHLARHRPDALAGIDLSRVVPGIAEAPALAHSDPESERYRLFEAVRAALGAAAARTPVLLLVDDLHWADKPTLTLLRHLSRARDTTGLLIVGTYRDVELDRTHPFAETLADLRRDGAYERILLRGLSPEDVITYLERRAGHALDEAGRALATALHRETEGNPFFIREIIRHLAETGAIFERGGRWTSDRSIEDVGLPESVREVIGRRLTRLSPTCGDVLSVASVIGRDFDLAVLARVTDVDEDRLADILDEAVGARGVIEEVPGVLDRFTFAHALVRETLYEELSTSRRVRLHRRVGEAIEDVFAADVDAHVAELAHHFHEASVAGAEEKAVDYSRRAAARAVEQLAYEEAAAHLERAVQTLDAMERPDPEALCETLISAAEGHQVLASLSEARRLGARAAEIARRQGWPERLARAALAYGGLWIDIGQPNEPLLELLREGIATLPDDHPLVPLLEGRLAMDLFSGDPVDLEAHSARAVDLARRRGDPGTLAYALIARRHAVTGPERLDERFEITAEAIRLAREVGDPGLEMRARSFRIIELVEAADVGPADAELEEFFRLIDEYRQPFYFLYMRRFQKVGLALREGRFAEAEETLEAMRELVLSQGRVTALIATTAQRLHLKLLTGRLDEIGQETIDVMVSFGTAVPWGAVLEAWTLFWAGRDADARAAWGRVSADHIRGLGDHWTTLIALEEAADLVEAYGDRELAAPIYERLLPFAGRLAAAGGTALVTVFESVDDSLGLCAEVLGRHDDALRHYEASLALLERWRMRPARAIALIRAARVLSSRGGRGDTGRARDLLDEALAEAEAMGLRHPLVAEGRALRATL